MVFLMFLLISADSSSQISGDGNKTGLMRVLHELKRQKRSSDERLHVRQLNTTVEKPNGSGQDRSPPDRKTEDPQCKTGWYMEQIYQKCQPCRTCENGQVEVKICTATANAVCGCKSGYYKDCNINDGICDDFFCFPCISCMAKNRTTSKNCSEEADTECGDCLPEYSLSANKACLLPLPPPSSTPSPTLSTPNPIMVPCNLQFCPPAAPGFKVEFVSLFIIVPLLLVVLIVYCKKRRAKERSTSGSLLSLPQPGLLMLRTPLHHSAALQGRQLYTIIDVVPVRRWKEFVRNLGLRDSEIEAVELENRQLREQQYEMLKCWRQKKGANMEAIFAILEEMDLEGCVQELQQLLQTNNSPSNP